jgi:hypothetical protein
MNYGLIITLGIIGYLVLNQTLTGYQRNLQVTFSGFWTDLKNFKFGLKFNLYNPTPASFDITNFFGNVEYQGKRIADFVNMETTQIKPGNNIIQVPLSFYPGNTLDILKDAGKGNIVFNYSLTKNLITVSNSIVY